MLIVTALGGNALLRRGEPMTAEHQRANVRLAARALAELILAGHSLVITHGNGPQVGLLALQAAAPNGGSFPLDVLGAETEGMIGYMIEQELGNILKHNPLATLLTLVRVDEHDPAFLHPTKFIGPIYDAATARQLAKERGWRVAPDGESWRRVVASPRPLAIMEAKVISLLVSHRVTVICAGGGGIPVIERRDGSLAGIEAVIDKDAASALLAEQLNADMLLLLTDVDAVYLDYGTPKARALGCIAPEVISDQQFPAGSMAPKVAAAVQFATRMGRPSGIGRLEDAGAIARAEKGTFFDPQLDSKKL
ncbi:carbamate kinase [Rhizobium sp. P28RR-XV]|uniref:carbamate kinase n=1 Tax=Rhizobium sp. P28RR-XV TaxID=2726737 RepID=UPI00145667B8|nr:carbamate kinase [Rhizobium sp. P28RR-XV]NLR86160.1 carbamate kinase [Rhizobium sp. P28RR-XV]